MYICFYIFLFIKQLKMTKLQLKKTVQKVFIVTMLTILLLLLGLILYSYNINTNPNHVQQSIYQARQFGHNQISSKVIPNPRFGVFKLFRYLF
jgi:hypothetical protein